MQLNQYADSRSSKASSSPVHGEQPPGASEELAMQWDSARSDYCGSVALLLLEGYDVLFLHRAKRIHYFEVFASEAEVEIEQENLVYDEDRMEH